MFTYRLLKALGMFLFITIPLIIVGVIGVGIYLTIKALLPKNINEPATLPYILRWFDCADLYPEFGRTPVTYLFIVIPQGRYEQFCWLTLRNPLNYFSYKYLSIQPQKSILVKTIDIVTQGFTPPGTIVSIGDSTSDMAGYQYVEYVIDGVTAYEYYYVHAFTSTFLKGKCFRFRLGHKLGLPEEVKYGKYIQDVFNIQPTATYSGHQVI